MGSDIGLTCSLELGFAFWTRWKLLGLFANLSGPRGESVSKGYILLEAASVLHDTTSYLLRVLTVGFIHISNPNMPLPRDLFPSE
jgi:hypothetical protein